MVSTIRKIPGYTEATADEAEQRQEAWLALEPDICGIPVTPLTLRKILYLNLAKNPFIHSETEEIALGHIAEFLWVVSAAFAPGAPKPRQRFHRQIRHVSVRKSMAQIAQYLERSFFDAPVGSGGTNHTAPKLDWIANCIHRFASEYGYTPDTVLDMSFRQIIQLSRCQKGDDPEASKTLANPSDSILAGHLENLNTRPTS